MKMTFRWYGEKDPITLTKISQVPYIDSGIVSAVYDVKVGEIWPLENIQKMVKQIHDKGMVYEVIESLPVHEDIKMGLPTRDKYIENYKQSLRNLAACGLKVITYNFMPVWDWFRTTLAKQAPDGSNALAYDHNKYLEIFEKFKTLDLTTKEAEVEFNKWKLPGWDSSFSFAELAGMLEKYKNIDEQKLWENLEYFLKGVMPTVDELNIKMAIHPDDPPWSLFGLPRIITTKENIARFLKLYDSPNNGITACTGSLGCYKKNDPVDIVKTFVDRIYFVHLRNVKITGKGDDHTFEEVAHHYQCGTNDQLGIVKALVDANYKWYIRSDHGRMIWDEKGRAGYGLFDRALGAAYLTGIIHGIQKEKKLIKDLKKPKS